eukprot:CAMPEP_0174245068 /NCGR_PEP_ID=MMETSP0417-20130205/37539_1 /TAXON_ID=242541 /ORGANISM="Mayorella sp, Strain BSH-02190019" /LENGTH=123 /DNA_ID=CAMNT_0015324817 /DNA_START=214 /DNA_END=581 /DNA_ORIENTATION=+
MASPPLASGELTNTISLRAREERDARTKDAKLPASALNRWVHCYERRPRASIRLFCLPFGGGSAHFYSGWHLHLPSFIEVLPIQLPARSCRLGEQPVSSMQELCSQLAEHMQEYLDQPYALFG